MYQNHWEKLWVKLKMIKGTKDIYVREKKVISITTSVNLLAFCAIQNIKSTTFYIWKKNYKIKLLIILNIFNIVNRVKLLYLLTDIFL